MTDKRYIQIYAILCAVALILVAAAFLSDSGNHLKDRLQGLEGCEIHPTSVNALDADILEYNFTLKEDSENADSLVFFTRHRFIDAYMDGTRSYSLQIENPQFGNTAGCLWNFVEIPAGTKQAMIRVTTSYKGMEDEKITFYYGNAKDCYEHLLKQSLPALILGLLNMVIGLFMIACWLITHKHVRSIRASLLHLGSFSCILGVWSIMESEFCALIVTNQQAASFFRYIIILFLPIPFLLFMKDFLHLENRSGWKILFALIAFWIPINIGLQLLRIFDMKQIVIVAHTFLATVLLYTGYCIVMELRDPKHKENRFLKVFLCGAVVLLIALIINLAGYYIGITAVEFIGQTGFLFYILILGTEAVKEVFSVLEAGQKAEIYRTLAIKDVLTGMYNRNAYIEEINKIKDPSDIMILTFDLNNLKQCNDQQGHMFGDKYIIEAAAILENVFTPPGNCYRIGGDEFCVILPHAHFCNIQELIHKMLTQQEQYNKTSLDIFMQIACGYALYDASKDRDIEATRSRADAMMYENKRQLKEATGAAIR